MMQGNKGSQTRWHKASKASMLSHKGERQACYKAHRKANRRKKTHQKAKKRRKKTSGKHAKHHKDEPPRRHSILLP